MLLPVRLAGKSHTLLLAIAIAWPLAPVGIDHRVAAGDDADVEGTAREVPTSDVDPQGLLRLSPGEAFRLALRQSADYRSLVDELRAATLKVRPQSDPESTPSSLLDIARELARSMRASDTSHYRAAGSVQIHQQLSDDERELLRRLRSVERYQTLIFLRTMAGPPASDGSPSGAAAGATVLRGYYGLLQQQLVERHQRASVVELRQNLAAMKDALIASLTSIPDDAASIVDQRFRTASAEQALLDAESELLSKQTDYQNAVDQFKRQLGLPASREVRIDNKMIGRRSLVAPELRGVEQELSRLLSPIKEANLGILESFEFRRDPNNGAPVVSNSWNGDLEVLLGKLQAGIGPIRRVVRSMLQQHLEDVTADIDALRLAIPQRNRDLAALIQLCDDYRKTATGDAGLGPSRVDWITGVKLRLTQRASIDDLPAELAEKASRIEQRMRSYLGRLDQVSVQIKSLIADKPAGPAVARRLRDGVILETQSVATGLSDDLSQLILLQAHARTHAAEVTPVALTWNSALRIANRQRRDWMNARAELVRLSHQVEPPQTGGDIELTFGDRSGSIPPQSDSSSTIVELSGGDAQLRWTSSQANNSLRLTEFRQALRKYDSLVAEIETELKSTLRRLRHSQIAFELQRSGALLALRQSLLADDARQLREARGRAVDATDRHDAIRVLANLRRAERKLTECWVDHELQRMRLDQSLGTMTFDGQGNWIDPGALGEESQREQRQDTAADPEFIIRPHQTPAEP